MHKLRVSAAGTAGWRPEGGVGHRCRRLGDSGVCGELQGVPRHVARHTAVRESRGE